MKKELVKILEEKRQIVEAECFCGIAIKGGYENYFRDLVIEGLIQNGFKGIDTEVTYSYKKANKINKNRLDITLGLKSSLTSLIELGHNGTWQSPKSLIKHAVDDINRSFDLGFKIKAKERYTISILSNIKQVNNKKLYKLRKSYIGGIIKNIESDKDKVKEITTLFKKIDKDVEFIDYETSCDGFILQIRVFVCGSFASPILS